MSEEEKLIEYLQSIDITRIFYDNPPHDNHVGIGKAIQGLLDLYNKEKERNKKYETSDYETICLENKHLLEQLEICQADLEEMTIFNNRKKENWIHKNTLNSYILKSKLEEILDRYAYTKLDDEEKIIRFYKELQELLVERN